MNTPVKHLITLEAARFIAGYTTQQASIILGLSENELLEHEADPGNMEITLGYRMSLLYKTQMENICFKPLESYTGKHVTIVKLAF